MAKKGGKVKFRRAGVRHLATFGKTRKQRRHLRGTDHLAPMDEKKIKETLPYAR
jgi:large subunit ribosomal protein L35